MKKLFLPLILTGLMVFVNTSCDDALDINEDPLAATQVDPNLLFPEVFVNASNNRTIEVSGRLPATQQWEGGLGVFNDAALGNASTFLVGNTWTAIYNSGLKNLVLAEQTAAEQDPQNVNVIAQCKIMEAFLFYNLTVLWERVPFTEALDPSIEAPIFDEQRTILEGIVALIDEAVALIDNSEEAFRVDFGDMIYDGDLEKWEKFANAIKLKTLFLIANQDPGAVSAEISKTLESPIIRTLADEAEFQYFDEPGAFNPLWNTLNRFAGGENPDWFVAATTMFDIMNDLNDPRLATYYDESSDAADVGTGEYLPAATPGSFGVSGGASVVSLNILRPDFPDRYLTAPEVLLLEAEAILRGWASGDADATYRQGIQLSMDYFDGKAGAIAAADKEAYLNSLPSLSSLSENDALEAIALQLYLHNFMRTHESWTQWRRTGVPDLVVPQGSLLSGVIRRLSYPPDERGANTNTPQDPNLDAPMWFEN